MRSTALGARPMSDFGSTAAIFSGSRVSCVSTSLTKRLGLAGAGVGVGAMGFVAAGAGSVCDQGKLEHPANNKRLAGISTFSIPRVGGRIAVILL